MLVKIAPFKWSRDPEVSELIDHLNQKWESRYDPRLSFEENKKNALAILSKGELRAIENEFDLCQEDFSYAARNYFWLEDKETRRDILFRLWSSQELILEALLALKAKGVSQRVMIVKARQLGCSSVVEGLGAWRTIFFTNINGLIISHDPDHAAYLFGITQKFYDKLPWWLKPRCASREFKTGLIFDNPVYEERETDPGLNSKITAMGASAKTASAQGRRLSWAHISEFASFDEYAVREIIEEDVTPALSDSPETFAVLESTAKGAGKYAHWKWREMERLGDKAEWKPLFFPWFFDDSHRVTIDFGWTSQEPEQQIKNRANRDWTRCDYKPCSQYHLRRYMGKDRADTVCPTCNKGNLVPHIIPDEQLAWMERKRENAQGDPESLNKLHQEMASTAEEAFVASGVALFSPKAIAWAEYMTEEPFMRGLLRENRLHGVDAEIGKCYLDQCDIDHRADDLSLLIWELPLPGNEYVIGGDVSHGLGGKNDSSVAWVLKINRWGGPDEQVARWSRNDVDPIRFAEFLFALGGFYNEALVACEMNNPSTTANYLQINLQYPNLYRMKSATSASLVTNRLGWLTNEQTKANLYHTMRNKLENRMVIIRDKETAEELKTFQKDLDKAKMGASRGFHDDLIMASMIALFCAHDMDWDEDSQSYLQKLPLTLESAPIVFQCSGCGKRWPASKTTDYHHCPKCRSMVISAESNTNPDRGDPYVSQSQYQDSRFLPDDDYTPSSPDEVWDSMQAEKDVMFDDDREWAG